MKPHLFYISKSAAHSPESIFGEVVKRQVLPRLLIFMGRRKDFSLCFSDTFQTHHGVVFWEAALKTCRCWQLKESSAATRREREKSSGWHHLVNNLSSLPNVPARWNCDFFFFFFCGQQSTGRHSRKAQ